MTTSHYSAPARILAVKCPACHVPLRARTTLREKTPWVTVWCPDQNVGCEHRTGHKRALTEGEAVKRWLTPPDEDERLRGRPPGKTKWDIDAPRCQKCGCREWPGESHECLMRIEHYARTGEQSTGL